MPSAQALHYSSHLFNTRIVPGGKTEVSA